MEGEAPRGDVRRDVGGDGRRRRDSDDEPKEKAATREERVMRARDAASLKEMLGELTVEDIQVRVSSPCPLLLQTPQL